MGNRVLLWGDGQAHRRFANRQAIHHTGGVLQQLRFASQPMKRRPGQRGEGLAAAFAPESPRSKLDAMLESLYKN